MGPRSRRLDVAAVIRYRTCQEAHPDFCSEVTWESLAEDILVIPAVVVVVFIMIFPILHRLWKRNSSKWFLQRITRLVGSVESDTNSYPILVHTTFAIEVVLSLWFALQWVHRIYQHKVDDRDHTVDQLLCVFFMVTYLINACRHQCSVTFVLEMSSLITVFTVVPTFFRKWSSANWFSFSYLRIINAVVAYEKLEKTGALRDVSEIKRGYAVTLLRTLVLVVVLSGTVFSLEVLGDPKMFQDTFVETEMGYISFIQMVYWIFTTISTVGYGDFAPTTTLSRLFIIIAIVVGVYFFSTEINSLVELHKLQNSGKGKWKPYSGHRHVIVIGGGVRGSSSVLKSFLEELFRGRHSSSHFGWPNLSFMASTEQPQELREAIAALPKHGRLRTHYFMGDPTRHSDMERMRMGECSLVFVMTDLHAADMDQEDTSNILRALAVKQSYPHINLRLMLQRPASKMRAVRVGIWPTRCFSINELKSALFALSCVCRGWSTMITHMLVSEENAEGTDLSGGKHEEEWVMDFKSGRNFTISGLTLSKDYEGMEWVEFVRCAASHSVMPIAVQLNGRVMLNPNSHFCTGGEVIFAIAPNRRALRMFDDEEIDWRELLVYNQREAASRAVADSGEKPRPKQHKTHSSMSWFRGATSSSSSRSGTSTRHFHSQFNGNGMRMPWAPPTWGKQPASPHHRLSTADFLVPGRRQPGAAGFMASEYGDATNSRDFGNSSRFLNRGGAQDFTHMQLGTESDISPEEQLQELQMHAEKIAEEGGHYIVVVLAGNPWQQVATFMRTLRARHLPFHIPLVILADSQPPSDTVTSVFKTFPRVAFMKLQGACQVTDLMMAGMMQARCITLFAGNAAQASATDRRMVDGAGVTLLAGIESAIFEHLHESRGPHVILELHRQESVKFMHRFPLYEDRFAMGQTSWAYNPKESFTNHPRFASGGIFTASALGALVARSYYTPGISELIEALVLSVDQSSFTWQISLPPELKGKTYWDLIEFLLQESGGTLCLGLYRKCFANSTSGYVVTNPKPGTLLKDDDLAIVLGNLAFGSTFFDKGLIPGALNAPRDYDPEHRPGETPEGSDQDSEGKSAGGELDSTRNSVRNSRRSSARNSARAKDGESAQWKRDGYRNSRHSDAGDGIPPEAPLPSLPHLQEELAETRRMLSDSLGREAALRAQLRACQWPLPETLQSPRATDTRLERSLSPASSQRPPTGSPPAPEYRGCLASGQCNPHAERVEKLERTSHV